MNTMDTIRTRKSVRTFDGKPLTEADRAKLCAFVETITNPYDIPVEFVFLNAEEYGLSSPVIEGEKLYVAGKVEKRKHCEEAFGYSFEKLVLYAWSLGVGTTWIGGTMKRELFEDAAGVSDGVIMPIVSPLGYPANTRSEVDAKLREAVRGDDRLDTSELFYDGNFDTPLIETDSHVRDALEAVRLSPSAANMQPCRVVRKGKDYHFYLKHTPGYSSSAGWDVQKIDMGIAICHMMTVTDGQFSIEEPRIKTEDDTEYIATVSL